MMEYILSWAAIVGSIIGLFVFAGEGVQEKSKARLADWLLGVKRKKRGQKPNWSTTFVDLFDRIFSKKKLSWTFIWRSVIASLCSVLVMWVLLRAILEPDNSTVELRLPVTLVPPFMLGGVWAYGFFLVGGAILYNLLPDYLSLLVSRQVLSWMTKARSSISIMGLLIVDALVTYFLFASITGLLLLTLISGGVVRKGNFSFTPAGPPPRYPHFQINKDGSNFTSRDSLSVPPDTFFVYKGAEPIAIPAKKGNVNSRVELYSGDTLFVYSPEVGIQSLRFYVDESYMQFFVRPYRILWDTMRLKEGSQYAVFLYSTFFTSVWVWLYVASLFTLKLLVRLQPLNKFVSKHWDVRKKPFRYLGLVAILIVTLLFIVAAPFVL